MGKVYGGIHWKLALKLKELIKPSVFIETGTLVGKTAMWANNYFDQVFTIEASDEFYNKANNTLKNYNNVQCIFGDSVMELSKLKNSVNTLFWLDAHYSGGKTYGKNRECPLLEELEVINEFEGDNIIMIDDARYFLSPPSHPHDFKQWPEIADIVLLQVSKEHRIYALEDVIISVHKKHASRIKKILQDSV